MVYHRVTLELTRIRLKINHKKVKRLITKKVFYALTPKAKYKSHKEDMNGTTKNLSLDKVIDIVYSLSFRLLLFYID